MALKRSTRKRATKNNSKNSQKNSENQVKEASSGVKNKSVEPKEFVSTGCTLVNLAYSDRARGGYQVGRIYNEIGDSSSGKSLKAWSTMAEAANNPEFDDYTLIYDDVECASCFDVKKLFGNKLYERLTLPNMMKLSELMEREEFEKIEDASSNYIQDFHMNVKDFIDQKKPFIYILDSFDALDSWDDEKKINKARAARKEGNEPSTGSYGTSKAKVASSILRDIKRSLKNTNSILIIISQVRDNLNAMAFGSKKTRSGGKALKFYSTVEAWLALGKQIKSKERMIGVNTILKTGKCRITGKLRSVEFPIYYDLGIDDVTANIEFLMKEKHWKGSGQNLKAPEFEFEGSKKSLIKHIEQNNLEEDLKDIVEKVWLEIEESLKLDWRKKRYE